MRFNDLEQGTTNWLEWRRKGIGASEAAAVLGLSPWTHREDLLREKTSPARVQQDDNHHTLRGKKLEPVAREMYEDLMGWGMEVFCASHDEYDFIRASFDGVRKKDHKIILEIKCPSQRWHEHTLTEGVPDWYFAQIQHQLLVNEKAELAHFVSYCPAYKKHPFVIKTIKRDKDFQTILLKELILFWAEIEKKCKEGFTSSV